MGGLAANPDEVIPDSEETSRLAVVDLDWSQVPISSLLSSSGLPLPHSPLRSCPNHLKCVCHHMAGAAQQGWNLRSFPSFCKPCFAHLL